MPADIVSQLLLPAAYPHKVDNIQLRETHISWVFLTGDWAYKVKKPRDLGFLDYSSLEARKHFCEEELRLNRRFAPELYLDVVPIREQGGLHIEGEGPPVDYAVKMRQFDDDELLSHIAERDGLSPDLIRSLGGLLARTHARLSPVYPESGAGTPLAMHDAMVQNFDQIAAYPLSQEHREWLAEVERWSTHRVAFYLPAMIRRIEQGFVKDCHGDLHLGNIARIDGELCFFDCIEFNDDFRIMDTIAEAAFLVMDCQARGLEAEAMRLLNDYLEYSGDYEGLALFNWYRCYYAIVRAKVNLLRLETGETELVDSKAYQDFSRYLELAVSTTYPVHKFLAITFGVSGSGKSTLAMQLLEHTGAIRMRSDVERKRLFELAPESSSTTDAQLDIYTREAGKRTFARLQSLAGTVLQAGFPAIVDATFLRRKQRQPFKQLAEALDIPFIILSFKASRRDLRKRIERRNNRQSDASEADVAIMEQQLAAVEALGEWEAPCVIVVGDATPFQTVLQQLRSRINNAEPV
jgi:hypothetical protein